MTSPQERWIADAAEGDPAREAELRARWEAGEPLQYVLGRWGFRSLDLAVDPRALIPRPETEVLVEVALSFCPAPRQVVDLGTGTGAIALSVASECPAAEVWAVDISPDALELARCNDVSGRVRFLHGDWYGALPTELMGDVDLIVSNPPYVSELEYAQLDAVVREWEPRSALVSGPTGLECLATVIAGASAWLAAGGVLALECAPHQTEQVARLCSAHGLVDPASHPDLTGRARVVTAKQGHQPSSVR
ncbi:MAG TPA: peptide chain release factor N(5)-glutamine methyltransferase [Acidimicrobiales bacterium]|nr:peptide chain release factor N(5)-glutamine methyltransferase [Acidimicrobiales bacterium]